MTIARDEIFGPVLSILPYDTENEAIAIANHTIYGRAAARSVLRVPRRMRTWQIDVNGTRFNPVAPFDGYERSAWPTNLDDTAWRSTS